MNDLSNLMDDTDPMDKDKDDANELEFANQYDSQGNFDESNEIIPATQQPAIIIKYLLRARCSLGSKSIQLQNLT